MLRALPKKSHGFKWLVCIGNVVTIDGLERGWDLGCRIHCFCPVGFGPLLGGAACI